MEWVNCSPSGPRSLKASLSSCPTLPAPNCISTENFSLLRQELERLEQQQAVEIEAFPLEILENIIIHLDLLSLLRLRSTCSFFYDTITHKLPLVWLKQYERLTSCISLLERPAIIDSLEEPTGTLNTSPVNTYLKNLPSAVTMTVGATDFVISRASNGIDAATAMQLDRKTSRNSLPRNLSCYACMDLCKDLLGTVLQPIEVVTPNTTTWKVYAFQPGYPLIPLSSQSSSVYVPESELDPNLPFSLVFVIDTTKDNPTYLLHGFYLTSAILPDDVPSAPSTHCLNEDDEADRRRRQPDLPAGWPTYLSSMEVAAITSSASSRRGSMSAYVSGIFAEKLLCGGAQTLSLQPVDRFQLKQERWAPTNNLCVRFWYTSSGDSSFDPPPVVLNPIQAPSSNSSSDLHSTSPTISPIGPSPISNANARAGSGSLPLGTGSGSGSMILTRPGGSSRMICRREIRSFYDGATKTHVKFTSGLRVAVAVRASFDLGGRELIFGIKFK